jgi:competence protein ComGC
LLRCHLLHHYLIVEIVVLAYLVYLVVLLPSEVRLLLVHQEQRGQAAQLKFVRQQEELVALEQRHLELRLLLQRPFDGL